MSIRFPPDVEARIQEMVESGRYADTDSALRAAVRLLEEHDRHLEWVRHAVAEGFAQVERGEGIPYTVDLLDEIDREVDERFLRGEKPGPDVCP